MNDLSVILRWEYVDCGAFKCNGSRRTSRSVRLDMEKIVKIGAFVELECLWVIERTLW